jgi:serine/threonine protein kinase
MSGSSSVDTPPRSPRVRKSKSKTTHKSHRSKSKKRPSKSSSRIQRAPEKQPEESFEYIHARLIPAFQNKFADFTPLTQGAFGHVYLDNSNPDDPLALKLVPNNPAGLNEVRVLQLLDHPNIIKPLTFVEDPNGSQICIVMPYISLTLLDIIQQSSSGSISEARARSLFLQLVDALDFLHFHGFIHKDIKLENILYDEETNTCLLADFGMAQHFDGVKYLCDNLGSLHYSAPEIWSSSPYRGPEVDIWALGVTLYLLVTGVFPFGGSTPAEVLAEIREYDLWFPPELSPDLQNLLLGMLARHSYRRMTLADIRSHPWVIKAFKRRTISNKYLFLSATFHPSAHEAAIQRVPHPPAGPSPIIYNPSSKDSQRVTPPPLRSSISYSILSSTPVLTNTSSTQEGSSTSADTRLLAESTSFSRSVSSRRSGHKKHNHHKSRRSKRPSAKSPLHPEPAVPPSTSGPTIMAS